MPAPHSHEVPEDGGVGALRAHRLLLAVVASALVATVAGLALLWPTGEDTGISEFLGAPAELDDGRVRAVRTVPCAGTQEGQGVRCRSASVELTSGVDEGTVVELETSEGPGTPTLREGDRIVVGYAPDAPPGLQYYFADFQRRSPLVWLTALFVVAVVLLGRVRGLRALVGLALSLVVLVTFVLPAILEGSSPIAVAVVGSSAILLVNLYLAHGLNVRTTTAVVGTLASLGLIGVLAVVFVATTHLTGLASEEATFLQAASSRINLEGLLLGGIVIGSLGVLDDVTVTQASAVWELHLANPARGPGQLYGSALRIGRDHIASTVNTLVLAYAGASLPLLILLVEANRKVANVLTGEVVAVEIVRTLVGSIGLVASVPITTGLAALVVGTGRPRPGAGEDAAMA
ncbi:MAG: YibE/F family protein [Actinomycetota bacterium]|nr:YibE/F family protein [Actinomycetota bacterium]